MGILPLILNIFSSPKLDTALNHVNYNDNYIFRPTNNPVNFLKMVFKYLNTQKSLPILAKHTDSVVYQKTQMIFDLQWEFFY